MTKLPYIYTDKQLQKMEEFVEQQFGPNYYVAHEIESEYVHTDTLFIRNAKDEKFFVSCGMGAREMNAPDGFKRCEIVMSAREDFVFASEKGVILAAELARISKFPFRKDTWLGTGHTLDASEKFKKAFGYDYFAFIKLPLSTRLPETDDRINFLMLVPIYEEEREWCVKNHTLAFLDKLHEKHGGMEYYADYKRDLFIPDSSDEEEIADYNVMSALGIDRPTFEKLCEFFEEQEQKGIEVTYDMIGKWVEENR